MVFFPEVVFTLRIVKKHAACERKAGMRRGMDGQGEEATAAELMSL